MQIKKKRQLLSCRLYRGIVVYKQTSATIIFLLYNTTFLYVKYRFSTSLYFYVNYILSGACIPNKLRPFSNACLVDATKASLAFLNSTSSTNIELSW